MKRLTLLILALAGALACTHAQQLAFPGAEGYGRFTTGGRGGNVYYVTRLDDCTDANLVEGTLRWALRTGDDTPRTVLFKVCGTIVLTSKLKLDHPNVTIAGQTAPGGGICIAGCNIYVCKPNVIIRHIRFRSGDIMKSNYPCLDVENTKNVIIDHCSMTWAVEECLTMYDCDSTTVQWSIIGEGLYNAGHKKGERAYATQWGGEHGTMHHCLITNCYNRTPRFNGVRDEADLAHGKHNHDAQVDNEFINNVIFNWGKNNSVYGGENDTTKNRDAEGHPVGYNHVYMQNNFYKPGPLTRIKLSSDSKYRFVIPSTANGYGCWWLSGNKFEGSHTLNANNIPSDWPTAAPILTGKTDSAITNIVSADSAYQQVCRMAGASLPRYDEEDERLLQEAAGLIQPRFAGNTQKTWKGIIDSQFDITFEQEDHYLLNGTVQGGYPFLDARTGEMALQDTDGDGMPDNYESSLGLNPNDPADGNTIHTSGYTQLELWLNGVADGAINKADFETVPYTSVEPVPSALLQLNAEADNAHYILTNGQVQIQKNGQKYTLSGQKLQ